MSVFSLLKQRYRKIVDAGDFVFSLPPPAQARYLSAFGNPWDDIERGYFQYKCQIKLLGRLRAFLFGASSFFLFFYFYYRLRHKRAKTESRVSAVYFDNAEFAFLPPGILGAYTDLVQIKTEPDMSLDKRDAGFIRLLIRRHPLSWYFILKCMLKTAMYSNIIRSFTPDALIVSNESSFTSSVMTAYCERSGIKHINIMHGEKLFTMRDSFFRFHECYIWDEYYRRLFIGLRADPSQFIIEAPPAMLPWDKSSSVKTIDFTYYLQNQEGEVLRTISNSLKLLRSRGYTVAVRPHPLFTDKDAVGALFGGLIIEDVNEVSIEKSISRTGHVISLYSTVLKQALTNGTPVVIDDISDAGKFRQLSELSFFSLQKEHALLSEIMSECRVETRAPSNEPI